MGMVRTFAAVALVAVTAAAPLNAKPRLSSIRGQAVAGLAAVDPALTTALARINELRRQAGAAPLVLNSRLSAAEQAHADDMAAKGYFAQALFGIRGAGW